jgi:hypothetical protein
MDYECPLFIREQRSLVVPPPMFCDFIYSERSKDCLVAGQFPNSIAKINICLKPILARLVLEFHIAKIDFAKKIQSL